MKNKIINFQNKSNLLKNIHINSYIYKLYPSIYISTNIAWKWQITYFLIIQVNNRPSNRAGKSFNIFGNLTIFSIHTPSQIRKPIILLVMFINAFIYCPIKHWNLFWLLLPFYKCLNNRFNFENRSVIYYLIRFGNNRHFIKYQIFRIT